MGEARSVGHLAVCYVAGYCYPCVAVYGVTIPLLKFSIVGAHEVYHIYRA